MSGDAMIFISGLMVQTATIILALRSSIRTAVAMEHRLTSIEVKVEILTGEIRKGYTVSGA